MNLYAILLGGKIRKNHIMEDHHLIFVVAKNEKIARTLAKKKWEADEIHIDGYKVILEKTKVKNNTQVNNKYSV